MLVCLTELCSSPLDLVIVIDKSDYWTGEFSQLINGVSTLVMRLFVGADMTHIAVVSYAYNATLHFDLVRYFQAGSMQGAIRQIRQDDSGTTTDRVSHTGACKSFDFCFLIRHIFYVNSCKTTYSNGVSFSSSLLMYSSHAG